MKNIILKSIFIAFVLFLIPQQAQAAKMILSPASGDLITNCANTVSIIVDTEGVNTVAADAFLNFNPNEIEIIDQISSIGGTQLGTGSAYETYPGNVVGDGSIKYTGFNRTGYFNGRGVLGTIKFKAKPGVTKSSIFFQFAPGNTRDSNVANADSTDVLSAVSNATYTFKEGDCGLKPAAPTKPAEEPEVAEEPEQPDELMQCQEELELCRTTLTSIEEYYKETGEPICEGVRPAAPTPFAALQFIWLFLILFLISMALNIYQYGHCRPQELKKKSRLHRVVHKIKRKLKRK